MCVDIWMQNVVDKKMLELPTVKDLCDTSQFRIIPSTYPPINFFESLVEPAEMEALWEIESLTNDRLRQEAGDIFLVSRENRISGPGSSVVMAAFTHLSKPTRFSDGTYGVYYAGLSQETAIRETIYHRENFLRATAETSCDLTMRLYEGKIVKPFHDIREKQFLVFHDPNSYVKSQVFGKKLRDMQSSGLIYNSVRHSGGSCIAAFKPLAVSIPHTILHLKYIWNGERITDVLKIEKLLELS